MNWKKRASFVVVGSGTALVEGWSGDSYGLLLLPQVQMFEVAIALDSCK